MKDSEFNVIRGEIAIGSAGVAYHVLVELSMKVALRECSAPNKQVILPRPKIPLL